MKMCLWHYVGTALKTSASHRYTTFDGDRKQLNSSEKTSCETSPNEKRLAMPHKLFGYRHDISSSQLVQSRNRNA